jgi:hypothetical protein
MSFTQIVLDIKNEVVYSDKEIPITGIFDTDSSNKGWIWGKRIAPYSLMSNSRHMTYIGGHDFGLKEGTKLKHWQSGVIEGISFLEIDFESLNKNFWTPVYKTGMFSTYWDERVLYSDYSYSENVNDKLSSRHYLELRSDAIHGSIQAKIYKRLDTFEISSARDIKIVTAFTGIFDGSERIVLEPDELPSDWTEVETRKYEAIIYENALYFNQDMTISVGHTTSDLTEIEDSWEYKGKGKIVGRSLFATYFPLETGSVEVVTNESGTVRTWTEQDSLDFSESTDFHFSVDYDLGVITVGGYQAGDLTLAEDITVASDEIKVYPSVHFDDYPNRGILVIGSEKISYLSKGKNSFLECTRGYGSTTAATATKGALVEDVQHGVGSVDKFYIKYNAIPRVDYEVSAHDQRTSNNIGSINIHPFAITNSNNITQIVSQDNNLSSVVLSTDAAAISNNLYGPIYYGTDTARLIATGYDAAGNPAEDIELTIYKKSGSGYLNSTLTEYTDLSNTSGEISCFYNSPYNNDDVLIPVVSVTHDGSDTYMEVNIDYSLVPSEVWVFQILKHDPVLGTVGDSASAFGLGSASEPNGLGYIDVWMAFTEKYNDGVCILLDSSGVKRTLSIRWAEKKYDSNLEQYTRFYLNTSVSPSWISSTAGVKLFEREALTWDPVQKRGARVILYEWTTEAVHPIKNDTGAYMPIRPDEIVGNQLIFRDRLLPIPAPEDDSSNLGGYSIIAPAEARFGAYGQDPFTGNFIHSNDIRIKLKLPNALVGVDDTGILPIPKGWTLITEEFNIGAGLDGANFLTVNPAASGINQFNISGVF